MSDIVEQLRIGVQRQDRKPADNNLAERELAKEAADEIERQRTEIERLWSALQWIDTYSPEDTAAVESRFGLDIAAGKIK